MGREQAVLSNEKVPVPLGDQDALSLQEDNGAGEGVEAISGQAGGIYRIATCAGLPGTEVIFAPWNIPSFYARNVVVDNLPQIEQALHAEIAQDANGLFTDHLVPKPHEYMLPALGPLLYLRRITREMADDAMKTFRALANTEYEIKLPRPAMGYVGPEMEDRFMQRLESSGKLLLVNQDHWLFNHSGMKIPSALLFEKVYDDQIMKLILRDTGFGRY